MRPRRWISSSALVRVDLGLAVHVVLNRDQIKSILSLYHLEHLEDFGGIAEGAINTSYWVQVGGRKYFLRITERKRIDDMIYEKELLLHLGRHDLAVPRLLKNVAKGTFTPWSSRGRFVSLFEYVPGRGLGLFEVRPRHVEAVGRFAAAMHLACESFERRRANEFALPALERKLERVVRALEARRLPRRFEADVRLLEAELAAQSSRRLDRLPQGTVHGDLFLENARFQGDELSGILDFEMSSTERLIWDVAIAVNDWCWHPTVEQRGGPAGTFDRDRVQALLAGYTALRPLSAAERDALPQELRLAAARFALSRILDFELKRPPANRRVYKDYRHFMARLVELSSGGAEALVERCLASRSAL